MKLILVLLLAFASCCALAQASHRLLLESDPRPVVGEAAQTVEALKALPRVKGVYPIKLNPNLLVSRGLDVSIDDKVVHFAGTVKAFPDFVLWSGMAFPNFASVSISRKSDNVGGSIAMNGRMFTVFGNKKHLFLMEIDPEGVGKPASGVAPPRSGGSAPAGGKGAGKE